MAVGRCTLHPRECHRSLLLLQSPLGAELGTHDHNTKTMLKTQFSGTATPRLQMSARRPLLAPLGVAARRAQGEVLVYAPPSRPQHSAGAAAATAAHAKPPSRAPSGSGASERCVVPGGAAAARTAGAGASLPHAPPRSRSTSGGPEAVSLSGYSRQEAAAASSLASSSAAAMAAAVEVVRCGRD